MRCTSPRTVGFLADGKTISWSQKHFSKEFATFQLPCGKCIDCRLEYSRQWAIRCMHEASIHPDNIFLTLTYDNEHVPDKLDYRDFQLFMKKLRKITNRKIGFFVTGEYGEKTKRPHWHAIIFNYRPRDSKEKYKTQLGYQVWTSETIDKAWAKGTTEFGSVTMQSAGYCARYAAKKLGHGHDKEHEYEPISKKSNKQAIGKAWLEKYWEDVFKTGVCVLPDGTTSSIPRYYEKWLKENQPQAWLEYISSLKQKNQSFAAQQAEKEVTEYHNNLDERKRLHRTNPIRPQDRRRKLSEARLKNLQNNIKI